MAISNLPISKISNSWNPAIKKLLQNRTYPKSNHKFSPHWESKARQNSDYSAGYSIGSLQGRKQRKLSQNIETISEFQWKYQ
jgi:hypothetical protein